MGNKKFHTKEAILNAAKMEFAEKGLAGARIGSIAKRAKANPALIHYYFENKDKLYLAVLRHFFVKKTNLLSSKILEKWNLNASQRLYIAVYMNVNIMLQASDPDLVKIFFWEVAEGKTHYNILVKEFIIPRQEILVNILNEGIKTGEFKIKNPYLVMLNIVSFINQYAFSIETYKGTSWHNRLYGKNSAEEFLEFILDNVFRMVNPNKGAAVLPQISKELHQMLDEIISKIKEDM